MRTKYGQFCPVAKASEVLAERWMPLVVRELLLGTSRWADFRRGIPLISPAVLSRRLSELEHAGIVERRGKEWSMTAAGKELRPIIEQLGIWGQRWTRHEIERTEADPYLFMWFAHSHLDLKVLPKSATLLFRFPNERPSKRRYWLLVRRGKVEICLTDPGYDVDLTIESDVRTLASIYLGDLECGTAIRCGTIVLEGKSELIRSFPRWCPRSAFADVERPSG
jgi:DNA-binding HxlR family transcriptional regulator